MDINIITKNIYLDLTLVKQEVYPFYLFTRLYHFQNVTFISLVKLLISIVIHAGKGEPPMIFTADIGG